jgi:hypothetical protein
MENVCLGCADAVTGKCEVAEWSESIQPVAAIGALTTHNWMLGHEVGAGTNKSATASAGGHTRTQAVRS